MNKNTSIYFFNKSSFQPIWKPPSIWDFSKNGTLPETNSEFAPENRPGPKRKGSSSNHQFSGAMLVSFREGIFHASTMNSSKSSRWTLPCWFFQILTESQANAVAPGKATDRHRWKTQIMKNTWVLKILLWLSGPLIVSVHVSGGYINATFGVGLLKSSMKLEPDPMRSYWNGYSAKGFESLLYKKKKSKKWESHEICLKELTIIYRIPVWNEWKSHENQDYRNNSRLTKP